ncbi:MAG: XisH family protein [Spirulinaceae cyanobacterium]
MAKDDFHDAVKIALQKDGWQITHDPYQLSVGGVEMYIDLGAEQLLGAERNGTKIAVEIKSFISPSLISEFHTAHGQYLDYYYALEEQEPNRMLYLAVPLKVYRRFFTLQFIQNTVQRSQINLLVYNPNEEVILQWQ